MNMHKIVSKGWGWEKWVVNNDLYCGKILFVHKDKQCSFHYHQIKNETFYLQAGSIEINYLTRDDFKRRLEAICQYYSVSTDDSSIEFLIGIMGKDKLRTKLSPNVLILGEGDSFEVPVGLVHSFRGIRDSYITEFSTHHEDSDSYRIIKGD